MTYLPTVAAARPAGVTNHTAIYSEANAPASLPRAPTLADAIATGYGTLDLRLDVETRTFWNWMRPPGRPNFSAALLSDIASVQASIRRSFEGCTRPEEHPLRYYVLASRVNGIFNLGGDLGHFADRIRAGDRASLLRYGRMCIEAVHGNAIAFGTPAITIALVQGDALGGGFECALAFDLIIAERRARFGLPEILFNLFPGMGAYSFLSRRIGPVRAEQMIMSGKLYTAAELHEMGIVDVLAEDGEGEHAVREYIARHGRIHNAHRAIYETRRRVNPVTLDELQSVVEVWVDAALNLGQQDLRKMIRLATAQDRRMAGMAPPAHAVAAE